MFKKNFMSYVRTGILAGFLILLIANAMFLIMGLVLGHDISFVGQNRDTLYIVFISFATFISLFIGAILFYFFQKYTKKPVLWFSIIVLLGFLYNTYTAEVSLEAQYKLTAHILHLIVSALAIYFVPKLSRVK
ncbi:hypothetical protein IM538_12070 [Cytobacillus suaedae]|nr:hypothetical protein IM538_12070 [Cytobacillus suaedae]